MRVKTNAGLDASSDDGAGDVVVLVALRRVRIQNARELVCQDHQRQQRLLSPFPPPQLLVDRRVESVLMMSSRGIVWRKVADDMNYS